MDFGQLQSSGAVASDIVTARTEKKTVLLGDDHLLVLEGIAKILSDRFELAGMAQDGAEFVRLAKSLQPDFALVDISMPYLNGIEAVRRIRQLAPRTKVIVLTQHNDRQYMRAAFAAGASGYVLKQSAASELIQAIEEVQEGRYYVSKGLLQSGEAARLDPNVNPGELFGGSLTPRQREVVQLVAEGHSAKQIAFMLNISTKTVEFHKAGIMQQLGLTSTAELIRYAVETGIVRS
jgi:DNA-binding NarL/FixJ family response regulator